jgi:micrococcal nuclease
MDISNLYLYKAKVIKIIDGDTIDVVVDLGFTSSRTERLRFARIDAPEVRGAEREAGLQAKDWLLSQISPGSEIFIRTEKDDSFGRYIAEIYFNDLNLNDEMVKVGHAVYKDY